MESRTLSTNLRIDACLAQGTGLLTRRAGCPASGAEQVCLEPPPSCGVGAMATITQICAHSPEGNTVAPMQAARIHPRFAVRGPEPPALVSLMILAARSLSFGIGAICGSVVTDPDGIRPFVGQGVSFRGMQGHGVGLLPLLTSTCLNGA